MANPVNGLAVNFGFASTTNGITITELTGVLIQSADQTASAECEVTRGGTGAEVTHAWYNDHDEATLEFVITSATGTGTAITNTALALVRPGSFATITACASMPGLTADNAQTMFTSAPTKWEVQSGPKLTKTNTSSAKVSIPLRRYTSITAIASGS